MLKVLNYIALAVWTVASELFVLGKLWGWFVLPVFRVPLPSLTPSLGLLLIVNFAVSRQLTVKDEESIGAKWILAILRPSIALLLGWLYALYI
jgi:hypothetical protein